MKNGLLFIVTVLIVALSSYGLVLTLVVPNLDKYKLEVPRISNVEINKIYENMIKHTGLTRYQAPKLVIIDNEEVNAYADSENDEIGIYTGMIDFANDPDQIAAVLGHELGHIVMDHSILNPTNEDNIQTVLEGNADKFGIYLMMRAGYDPCKAKVLWEKLRERDGDYEFNSSHPNFSYRIWQFEFPSCEKHGVIYAGF